MIVPFVIIQRGTGAGSLARRVTMTIVHLRTEAWKSVGTWLARMWYSALLLILNVSIFCCVTLLRRWELFGCRFKTDSRNLISQRAIERLGASKEGVLRNHMILPDGYYRHSVYYSILDTEWAIVKASLEAKMSNLV